MIETLYKQFLVSHSVTTDSRKVTPGSIYFAFKGEHFDGNMFAQQALDGGAAYCVLSDKTYAVDGRCFVVDNVLTTLQQLALHHRKHLTIPVIGVTGTNGKTTTKELVRQVLERRYKVYATEGNFNNHLGVPLTLLSIPADADIAVVEMGANHPGEIAELCAFALPTCGLITNVGKAHLEGFGSFEGVVETKTALYRHLSSVGGLMFVNINDQRLLNEAQACCQLPLQENICPVSLTGVPSLDEVSSTPSMVLYGDSPEADVIGSNLGGAPYMKMYVEDGDEVYTIQSNLVGTYNFDNAMAAVAVGRYFRVEMFDIKQAIESYVPSNNRSQYQRTEFNNLYLDCYNANPSSMNASLMAFLSQRFEHKVAILGSMHELGEESAAEHCSIVKMLQESDIEKVLFVGNEFQKVDDQRFAFFDNTSLLIDYLRSNTIRDKSVLVKGSNVNKLWTVVDLL